ncbi:MAG: histidine kinase, partial [Roseburia sp.]|nr:histidine kinase [Roseburia sp.]
QGVQYLTSRTSLKTDETGNLNNLYSTLRLIMQANDYIDSICIYFLKSDEVVSDLGIYSKKEYQDNECLELYSPDMPNKVVYQPCKKNGKYPYLLTILYPISADKQGNKGAVVINIDVEELGDYIGSGQYRNKDYTPMLIILDEMRETIIYSDEYRLLKEGIDTLEQLDDSVNWENDFSQICTLWDRSYVVSGTYVEMDGFWYIYFSSLHQFEEQNQATNQLFVKIIILIGIICLLLASLLSIWVYKPIQRTIHVLGEVSMLTEWDKKEHMDEMEAIQRSILSAKKKQDDLNEQIQERIVSLHNAQICALQTQINPHFLYNTLEAIGNAAALLMNGDNKVTDMVFTLGRLMRISLAGENYLVPIKEELEHVRLYVKLMEFRFRGRIRMHVEIPEELSEERIVKLTLQPLIENAIEHGLSRKRSQGEIWIKGELSENNILISVIDNGEGISEERLKVLQEKMKVSTISDSKHIGLRNVNQRLKLVFGDEYGLSVARTDEGGIKVTICFARISSYVI